LQNSCYSLALKLTDVDRTVIIAVIAVRVVQVTINQVVGMVSVGDGFVPALRAMPVSGIMSVTGMLRRARGGVPGVNFQAVFIDMIAVRGVQVAIVHIVGVIIMLDGGVTATLAMHVGMHFVKITEFAHAGSRR
jgi:hypothetical protein